MFVTWPHWLHNQGVIGHFEWVSLVISDYPANVGDHRPFGRGDIKLSVCHVTSRDHIVRKSCDIMGEFISHCPINFGGHRLCGLRDIKLLIWQLSSRGHVIKRSCGVVGEFFSSSTTTLPIFVAIDHTEEEIFCFSLVMWPHVPT